MTNEERDIHRKLKVLQHAEKIGNARKAGRYFGIGRSSFYRWRDAYQKHGEAGLKTAKSIPKDPANQTPAEIVEKVLYLRRKYHLEPIRIVWYLARYHGINISDAGVYRKRGTPQLNGKVQRSHRSDQQEFYQLLTYKGDVDLEAKLDEWERCYNFAKPHGARNGQTPYEALRDKLQ